MNLTIALAVVLAAAFAVLGVAKLAKAPSMVARAGHVGFTAERYQIIGAAELSGAVGVVAGLSHAPFGYAAGVGLLLLLAGALLTHARQGDGPAELAPAALFAVATVGYLLALATAR